MNDLLQHIAVFSLMGCAIYFLWKKFFVTSKKSQKKGCASGSCGCP